ncbi:MAG: SIS domain-containing protein [Patescibacteria group bacterium]
MSTLDPLASFRAAHARHTDVAAATLSKCATDIAQAAQLIADAVVGNRIFACGNGGSAADSQHFVAEFACRYKNDRPPLSAIALTTNTSNLTAIANDYSFDDIFSRQIEALGTSGDVLVAFTTSGKSPNILRAVEAARRKEMEVIFMTGTKGAEAVRAIHPAVAIIVPTEETARIQEMHELIYHAWCEYVDLVLGVKEKSNVTT